MSTLPMDTPPDGTGQLPQPKPLIKSRTLYSVAATVILAALAAFLPREVIDEIGSERLHALIVAGIGVAIAFLRAAVARTEGAASRTPPQPGSKSPPAAMLALAVLPFLGGCESYPDTRPAVRALDATVERLEGDYRTGKVRLREDDADNAEALESRLSLIEKARETARIALEGPKDD